jgi:multimeric flavodoxin WrbA
VHINVLGIVASNRKGNSEYLLRKALEVTEKIPFDTKIEILSFRGKKVQPCISCFKCREMNGECILKDDFEHIRQKYLSADVVIYSVPLFNLSIPGQLKCFIDRLGQTMTGYYGIRSTRPLKITGNLIQGAHLYGGQEIALMNLTMHELLAKCIPVAGDGWESYVGAGGWTGANTKQDALQGLVEAGDRDALITLKAARSVVKRAVELAAIIQTGGWQLREELGSDEKYTPFYQRLYSKMP